ncbi:DNA-directed RNA polymerase subunit H [Candidatus Woesearchaeota archaeon]|nr:DNA-directed RNA polymerase subunit H [Candidatus Woesearchaeota archaeon]
MKKQFKTDKHSLIPKHLKLNEKEKQKILEQYNISLNGLPRIPKTDAAIVSLNAKPGDLIKIIRKSPTANESVFYRVVVNV